MVAAALVVLAPTLMLLDGCRNRAGKSGEQAAKEEKKAPARITVENGQTLMTLDESTQKRLGFTVATLASTVTRAQAAFPAVVLSVQNLAAFRNTYVAAQAQLQKARIQAGVDGKEYERLEALSVPEQNVSEKSVQAAQAALQSDEAEVRAVEQQLQLQASAIRQEWGDVVAGWAVEDPAHLQRLLDHDEVLIQLTMPAGNAPAGTALAPPGSISLEIPGGSRIQANFVSSFPRVDPRIQGRSFLYRASGRPELPPGLNLVAHLPVGTPLKGVVIPASAVVWSEGKAWVYSQVAADRFSRSPLSTEVPVENGFFAAEGFSAGDKIVTVGAQALLSEEMLLHSQGGGDEN